MRTTLAVAGLVAAAAAKTTITVVDEVTITSCAPTHTNCPYGKPTWAPWDPENPSKDSTTTASSGTWAPWDPSKPSTSSKPAVPTSSGTWAPWDPTKPSTSSKPADSTETWAPWDPTKPSTTSKPADSTETWAPWDPTKPSSTVKTPDADTATWSEWNTASTPAASTGCPQYTATAPPAWFSQLPTSVLSSLAAKWTGAPPADWCYYSYSVPNSVVTQTKTPVASTGVAESTWAAWQGTGTPVQGVTATGTGKIAQYTGAANANAASFVLAGAAAVAAVIIA